MVEEEIGDGVCVLRPQTNDVVVLNETAHAVWRVLAEPADEDLVVGVLADAYGIDAAQIRPDVARVLHDLAERGFLEEAPAGPPP